MNVFEFDSYKDYLNALLTSKRGSRKSLAAFLNCQPGYVSQVLRGETTDFSLEHLEQISQFLNLEEREKNYFLLLGQMKKAGSVGLRDYFHTQVLSLKEQNTKVASRIDPKGRELSTEDQAIYYSHWAYLAIHMLVSVPAYQTQKSIYEYFPLEEFFVKSVIEFLLRTGLIEQKEQQLSIGKTRIHLREDSPFINLLHQNFRYKAIENLNRQTEVDLHYSSALVLSKKDAQKIKKMILQLIQDKEDVLLPSPEETLIALNIDYFEL